MLTSNQQLQPSKFRSHLKTWQWIMPIAILAALVGGYFAYQNYGIPKLNTGADSIVRVNDQTDEENAGEKLNRSAQQADDTPLSVIGVYTYEITSMCVQSCTSAGIYPFFELTEPISGIESENDNMIVFAAGRLIEEDRLPTIAGSEADMTNLGRAIKTTLFRVERYQKIDFPKISLSQGELQRYLKNQDSNFDIEFENPFPDELEVSLSFYDLGDATLSPPTTIILKPLARTVVPYLYKGDESSEYGRGETDDFELIVTGGDKVNVARIADEGPPAKGRIIYVKQMINLEET